MEFEELDHYLLAKPHTRLDFPFGDDVNVYKVMDKMFALVSWQDGVMNMNLKCDPDEAASLVSIFDSIRPGYHMNKRHWITIDFKGEVPKGELQRLD